jgi:hypothetical protein
VGAGKGGREGAVYASGVSARPLCVPSLSPDVAQAIITYPVSTSPPPHPHPPTHPHPTRPPGLHV